MEINDKIIAAIIAGFVSMIGILVNIYLNRKSNRQLLNKIRIEHSLKDDEERKRKLEEFLFRVKKFQYTLLDILEEMETKEEELDLGAIRKVFRAHYMEVREEWMRITFQIHNANMKDSINLGAEIHDGIGSINSTIHLYLERFAKSKENNKEDLQKLKNLISSYKDALDNLTNLIIKEIKMYQENIFKPAPNN